MDAQEVDRRARAHVAALAKEHGLKFVDLRLTEPDVRGVIDIEVKLRFFGARENLLWKGGVRVVTPAQEEAVIDGLTQAVRVAVGQARGRLNAPAPPQFTGNVIGFRSWKVDEARGRIGPIGQTDEKNWIWVPGEWTEAQCAQGKACLGVPAEDHHDGFNSYFDLMKMADSAFPGVVAGAMIAKGRMRVHEDGFRAQYAKPLAFTWMRFGDKEGVRAFAKRLGVPAMSPENLVSWVMEFGDPLPEQLRLGAEPDEPDARFIVP